VILVVCALLGELRYVAPRSDVAIVACGVGPVEAAIGTANALARVQYQAVINAGIGGAFRGEATVGESRLIASDVLADLGLEGGGPLVLPGGGSLVESARADPALLARCSRLGIVTANGLTVANVTTTDATAARLHGRYAAAVESMEGFSVLRAAAVGRVPALEIRGISNYVGERARSEWDFDAGARATATALDAVLDHLAR
jgi:futalosine hydrolase